MSVPAATGDTTAHDASDDVTPAEESAGGASGAASRTNKFAGLFRKKDVKGGHDSQQDNVSAGHSDEEEEEEEEAKAGRDKGASSRLADLIMHTPGSKPPGVFAHSHQKLVKDRSAFKGNPRLRNVFNREHPFYSVRFSDSDKPCVGVAAQKVCMMNPAFALHLEWSLRMAAAALLAGMPAMLTYFRQQVDWSSCHDSLYECTGWATDRNSQCIANPNFMMQVCPFSCNRENCRVDLVFTPGKNWVPEFDPSYAAVVCVLAFGFSAGETHRFVWEVLAGVATAAIIPQLSVITFGSGWMATAIFLAFISFTFVILPIESMTKKFGLGLCVRYACVRSYWDEMEWSWNNDWTTYHVAKMGMYGALCAMLLQLLPFPRTSRGEALRCLNSATSDIMIALGFLVQSFTDGQTLQERTKAIRYIDHIAGELMALEQYLSFAWWEPGSENRVCKFKVCLATMHKLRANLHGMQQALKSWENEENRQMISEKADDSLMRLSRATMETLDGIVLYMTEGAIENDSTDDHVQNDRGMWNMVRRVTHRERLELQIKKHINGYHHLERQMHTFEWTYTNMRARCIDGRDDDNRLEDDEWLHLFLCSLTAFGQALLDFPDEYAKTYEARMNEDKMAEFIPEAKLVTLYFQKRYFITALKTAAAICSAFLVNVAFFEFDALAPVIIAYVMSGHYGGSYTNTASRCLGVLGGMIVSFVLIIFSDCDPAILGIGYAVAIGVFGYVRISSASHSYAALVASVVTSQLMVHECSTDLDEQYRQVRQCVLACAVMGIAETCIYPTNSLFFLRKQVCDTLIEMRVVFIEVFQSHLADCWANIERKAYVANMFAKGKIEEYRPAVRDKRVVDNSLWRNLPLYINSQEVLVQQAWTEPSFWRPPFPITAYDRLVYLNRHSVMFLTILQNHLARAERMRGESRQLIDEARAELTNVKSSLVEAIDELATSIRVNSVDNEADDVSEPVIAATITPNFGQCFAELAGVCFCRSAEKLRPHWGTADTYWYEFVTSQGAAA